MKNLKLQKTKLKDINGQSVRLVYDEEGDILDVLFGDNESATGIELNDHILLRINQKTGRAVSLTIQNFSILTEQTEYGPRSYPLENIDTWPEELRELVVRVLKSAPVNRFLKILYFQESSSKLIPSTYVESEFVVNT